MFVLLLFGLLALLSHVAGRDESTGELISVPPAFEARAAGFCRGTPPGGEPVGPVANPWRFREGQALV